MQKIQDHPIMVKHLQHLLWVFSGGLAAGTLVVWSNTSNPNLLTNINTMVLIAGVIVLALVSYLYSLGRRYLATVCMLCTLTIVVIGISWAAGGLNSIAIMIFPIILLFAAAYAEPKLFLPQFGVLLIATICFGLNDIYAWLPPPPDLFVKGIPRMLGYLLTFSVSGVLVWLVGKDLRFAFTELENEKARMAESNQLIQKLADHDSLTGLLSYQNAMKKYQNMLQGLAEGKEKIAFYFIDLDNFKLVNDIYDHSTGDELLVMFSQRLMTVIDEGTVVCRIGGDEFVLFKVVDIGTDFNAFSEKLVKLISTEPYKISATVLRISASVGVSSVKDKQTSFADVRKKADIAMIQAKQSGKNGYHRYSEALEDAYMSNLTMVNGLKQAVSLGLLELEFQAKVKLLDNRVVGAGAMLRWTKENPQGYQFEDFWPVIENTELIHEIGAWMIKQACTDCQIWQDNGHDLVVLVHVSAAQLGRSSFSSCVDEILVSTGLPPGKLILVLPENCFYEEEAEGTELQINKLKALGLILAIGGFGNGYSNLTQLTKLKIDSLCIDGNFVANIHTSESTKVVFSAIVDVATELNMMVSADGINSKLQADVLSALGCQYGQGSYWSQPSSASQLQQFVADRAVQVKRLTV